MSKYNREILLALSDSHGGFKVGLTNPEAELKDEHGNIRHPEMNDAKEFLWNDVYLWGISETQNLAGKDVIHAIHAGDISHGNKYIGEQASTKISDQMFVAQWNFAPVLRIKNVVSLRIAVGTGAHNFGEGTADEIVAALIQKDFPKKNIKTLYHGLAEVGESGFFVDYAHHGPFFGSRNWLRGNTARLYLQSLMLDDLDAGDCPANLVLRGHYHTFVKTWFGITRNHVEYESWLTILPSLCLLGDYATQASQSVNRVSPGMVAFEIINGKLHGIYPFIKTLDNRTRERI